MNVACIMVAQSPYTQTIVESALTGYELLVVRNVRAAKYQILEVGINLFVLDVHFDDSSATEVISFIREDDKHKSTPIIVVRLVKSLLETSLRATLNGLIKVGYINEYLELVDDIDAKEIIRKTVDAILAAEHIIASA